VIRPRRRSSRPEDAIQRAVFQHLRVRPAPGVFAFHPANGGFRQPAEAGIFAGLGVVAGVPDVIAIKDGRAYALELKTERGRLTATQQQTLKRLQAAGAVTAVVRGLDAAIRQPEAWGLLRGVAA
jgi:hypothetical protein